MSVSKAQVVYGIPHSTPEYKVKERNGKPQDTAQEEEARHRHDDDHAGNRWALPVPPTSGRVLDYRTLESRTDNT